LKSCSKRRISADLCGKFRAKIKNFILRNDYPAQSCLLWSLKKQVWNEYFLKQTPLFTPIKNSMDGINNVFFKKKQNFIKI
jgi:hypothetical protein